MAELKAVQFGAGNIGRGFLGELFHDAGYKIIFVEKAPAIVKEINSRGSYILEIVGPNKFEKRKIDGISALETNAIPDIKEQIIKADIIGISVGLAALPAVAEILAEGIEARNKSNDVPVNIIIAENVLNGQQLMHELLAKYLKNDALRYMDNNVGLVQAVISRMVPVLTTDIKARDPLYIKAEEYRELPVDRDAFKGAIPKIEGMKAYGHFEAYEERKLFIHNTGHAIAAYMGFLKGYKYLYEVMNDMVIRQRTMLALEEIGKALVRKHPFMGEDLKEHIEDLCIRFGNRALADTIARVGRDPLRKLGPEDRLVGACRFVESYGGSPDAVSLGISACLLYNDMNDPSSRKLREMVSSRGLDYVLLNVCGIKESENLYKLVREGMEELKKGVMRSD